MTLESHAEVLTESQAAELLRISRSALRQGRCRGALPNKMGVPPFVRLGRRIEYLRSDLMDWLLCHRIGLTAPEERRPEPGAIHERRSGRRRSVDRDTLWEGVRHD